MATNIRRLPVLPRVDQRRAQRTAVAVSMATVRELGQDARAAELIDLSSYGCRLAVAGDQAAGCRVWLRFDGGWPIGATVVWAKDATVGCRFDEPIPASLMRNLTRALN